MAHLLLVEDDQRIGQLVRAALTGQGYEVSWTVTGAEAVDLLRAAPVDLVVLDLGLPDLDGITVCRAARTTQPDAVVVMLTARNEDMDVIAGLEAGADDYLTKPFTMVVLLARVRAHLRRRPAWEADSGVLRCGDLSIDPGARRVILGETEIPLRSKQFELLERLARDVGRAVPRETLMAEVWDENWFGSTKTLDVHIATLRQRLGETAERLPEPVALPRILTVRGVGYQLEQVGAQ